MSHHADMGYRGLTTATATLPSESYYDPDCYDDELRAIWYRQWLYVGRDEDIPGPLHYKLFSIGSQSIVLLRDDDRQLRAFHNTCRHRGSRLITEPSGKFKGGGIVCPYHAWRYRLDGSLSKITSTHCPDGFDIKDYGLYDIAIENWDGLVFINLLGADAPPLEHSFEDGPEQLNNWPLADLRSGYCFEHVISCNWKIFWENFSECLHCPGLHPKLVKLVPIYGRGFTSVQDDPNFGVQATKGHMTISEGVREGALTWSHDGSLCDDPFPNLTKQEKDMGYAFQTTWPSHFMVAHPDHVRIVQLLPLGPEQTALKAEWFFRSESLASKKINVEKVASFAIEVMKEDCFAAELNQAGLHSIRHKNGVLMPEEHHVHKFQAWVVDQLRNFSNQG